MNNNDVRFRLSVDGAAQVSRELGGVDKSLQRMDGSSQAVARAIGHLGGLFAGLSVAAVARQFIQSADSLQQVNARLQLVSRSAADYAAAQRAVYEISQANNVSLRDATTLYARLADPVQKLGGGVREIAGMTDAVATALRISGASAAESSSAILQFSQAMAAGALRGEEFNSVSEAAPRLMQALSDALGKTRGELREMAEQGLLTADVVGNALTSQLGRLRAEAQGLPQTVGGAWQQLANDATLLAGAINDATGATSGLAGVLSGVAGLVREMAASLKSMEGSARDAAGGVDLAGLAIGALGTILETVIVVVADALHYLQQFGRALGAVGAAAGAMASGDFGLIPGILRAYSEDFAAARDRNTAFAKSIVGTTDRMLAQRDALRAGALSSSEMGAEMAKLARQAGVVDGGFVRLAGATNKATKAKRDAREAAAQLQRQLQLENAALQAQEDAYFEAAEQARLFAEAKERAAADEFDRVVADMQPTANALDRWSEQRGEIERVARESHERIAADWQRTADQMSQSLTDALMTGGKNVAEYLRGLFRTLVLRPILAPVSGSLAGLIAPGAAVAGGGGGALGGMGSIGSLLGGVGAFGSYAATGLMSTLTGAGGAAFGAAGSLLSGGSIAGGLGMAAGAAIPYVAAAAAAVKIFDLAFGRELKDFGIEGDIGAGGFEGGQYRFEKGGWFRSDRTTRSPLAAETEAGLDAAVSALYTSAAEAAEALGLNSDAITGYTESLKLSTKGLTDEQVQAKLSEFMAQLGENLARQVGLSAERLGSLASALTTVNDILGTFDQRLLQVSVAGGEAAEQLAALFGGVDNLGGALALYAEQFTFAGDSAAYTLDMAAKALQQVGLAVPATRDEFMRLVEAQDLMTESGRAVYAALLQVAGGMDTVFDAAEQAAAAAAEAAKAQAQEAAAKEQRYFDEQRQWQDWAKDIASTARTVRDSWRDVVKGIEAAIKKLRGDIVGDNAQAVRAQYASTLQAARGGDRAAIEALPALAQQLSRIGEGTARSAYELSRLRGTLAADLESVINAARGSSAARSDDMLSMLGRLQWIRVDPATGSYLLGAGGGGGGFSIGGAPGFASGGLHSGGWRVVGERGPELEATGPSRIHTGDQLGQAMGVDELRDEVRGMRQEMVSMQHAVVRNTSRMAKLLERVIPEGDALQVRTAT